MDSSSEGSGGVGRREFLRRVGVGGVAGAIVTGIGAGSASAGTRSVPAGFRRVWRLSNEGEQACGACEGHARHRYYRLAKAARHNRAHVGCNCDVIHQLLPIWRWKRFFVRPNGTLRNRWDTRWNRKVGTTEP